MKKKTKNKQYNPNIFEEIIELKTSFKVLSVDINWIKKELNELKSRIWWIISLIVGTLLTVILTKLI
jgi:chromosome segregation ATPase